MRARWPVSAGRSHIKNHFIHLYLFLSYYIQEFEKLKYFYRNYYILRHILDLEKIHKVYTELNVLNITSQGL